MNIFVLQAFFSALNAVTAEDLVSRNIVIEEAFHLLNVVRYDIKLSAELIVR